MARADDPHIATTSGQPASIAEGPAPEPVDPKTGQHGAYWVLSEAERAKGFVRPVRRSYQHVGTAGPKYPLRDLTDEERERFGPEWAKYEVPPPPGSPEHESGSRGRLWTEEDIAKVGKGCGTITTMSMAIAETYAREPRFYGATFCAGCRDHLRVGARGEFVWCDGRGDPTDERVGT